VGASRRGTLAEIVKTAPWMRRESQAEVISKIRKRRETSADITIIRKSSIIDMKNDISRILSLQRQDSVQKCDSPDRDPPEPTRPAHDIRVGRHQDSQKHILYRTKMESTNVPFTPSPPSPEPTTPLWPTHLGSSPIATFLADAHSLQSSNSKDSAEQVDSKGTGSEDDPGGDMASPQLSLATAKVETICCGGLPPSPDRCSPQLTSRQRIQRQPAYEECVSPIKDKAGGRRGSRPFLSPGEAAARPMEASPSLRGRRDSLSPDSAAEDGAGDRRKGRRDSRQEGSSGERDGSSRESSPRSPISRLKRWGRRRSSSTKDERASRSPDSCSSREPSPKFEFEGHPNIGLRRQSTTDEILIARGFRRESTTEDLMRCRNFRRQSSTADLDLTRRSGRRDSATQINDGEVNSMTVEMSQVGLFETTSPNNVDNMYENSNYHEECLKCNSCGLNLTGPNQRRARRFKNQILCDLHFADMALMESSDFMQQLRNFKAQSLGCAVARRKSSTTLIFPLPPQVPALHVLNSLHLPLSPFSPGLLR
jgi:hypothetical protein